MRKGGVSEILVRRRRRGKAWEKRRSSEGSVGKELYGEWDSNRESGDGGEESGE